MNKEIALETAMSVINTNNHALLGTLSKDEYPNIKALTKIKNDGIKTFYFMTNPISTKVQQISNNNKTCVYFFDPIQYIGILLEGTAEIKDESYIGELNIPKPDALSYNEYCAIVFTASRATVYYNYEKLTFEV